MRGLIPSVELTVPKENPVSFFGSCPKEIADETHEDSPAITDEVENGFLVLVAGTTEFSEVVEITKGLLAVSLGAAAPKGLLGKAVGTENGLLKALPVTFMSPDNGFKNEFSNFILKGLPLI